MLQRAIHTHIYDFLFIIVFTQAKMNAYLWECEYTLNYVPYFILDIVAYESRIVLMQLYLLKRLF